MATADRDKLPENFQPQKRSGGMTCLWGCLGALVVMAILCGGGAIWSYYYLPGIMAGQAGQLIAQVIDESDLPAEDKTQVKAQVTRVVDAFRSGQINFEKLGEVVKQLMESPVMGSMMLYAVEEKYIKPSGLSEEEKQQARLTLQRVLRGVVEEKIDTEELEPALSSVMEDGPNDQKKLKEKVTDEELRTFIAELKKFADEAEIPDEPYQVRIGEEVKKAVDKALGEGSVAP